MIPTLADYLSLVGVQKTMETIEQIRENLDHNIENLGLVLTMIDGRESIGKDSQTILSKAFEGKVFNTCIQRNSKFKELAQNQSTIFEIEKNSEKGNKNYRELAEEVLSRLNMTPKTKFINQIKKTSTVTSQVSGGAQ
jgi:chromosome partitioning protein